MRRSDAGGADLRRRAPGSPERRRADAEILAALADAGARATFFIQGRWAEAFPELARSIAEAGHLVGDHSFYHARLPV